MNKDNKNTELNDTAKKLHISDVMFCFCCESSKELKLIDDNLMCEDCYENGYSYDFKNWLFLERMVIK
jgi:hypothetical protein